MPAAAPTNLADELRDAVRTLATEIGPRHVWRPEGLTAAAEFVEAALRGYGYDVRRQGYEAEGRTVYNLEAELPGSGRPGDAVVVGAHYDTHHDRTGSHGDTPGANDNGSGVAALLALARMFAGTTQVRAVRFVAFVNEEKPFYGTDRMGSRVYARRCRERGEQVVAVIPETLGYYTDEPDVQRYPFPFARWFLPATGDFVAFLANRGSRRLVRRARVAFARHSRFPVQAVALPMPPARAGKGWSDDWSFWRSGYEGFAATDTAYLRYPHYHRPSDTPEKLDYPRFAEVVGGLRGVIDDLAGGEVGADDGQADGGSGAGRPH